MTLEELGDRTVNDGFEVRYRIRCADGKGLATDQTVVFPSALRFNRIVGEGKEGWSTVETNSDGVLSVEGVWLRLSI